MRILLRLAENRFYIRSPFHVKLRDMFNEVRGHIYDSDQQVHSFPLEEKDKLVDTLLVMDISIKEVKEFEVILPPPKVASYKINNDMIEVLATYSPEVIIAKIVVILN